MDHEDRKRAGTVTFDQGGKTRFGIAEKWHKDIPAEFWTAPPIDALGIAADIYRNEYWRPIRGFQIVNQRVASKCFDIFVNLPPTIAVPMFQRAAGVDPDGRFGPVTLAAVNAADPEWLLMQLVEMQKEHYKVHAEPKFMAGLLARAEAVPA
jgi:lysozyme family protein